MICLRFVRAPLVYPVREFLKFAEPILRIQLDRGLSKEDAYRETLVRAAILASKEVEPNDSNMSKEFVKDEFIRLNIDLDTIKSSTQRRDGDRVLITLEPYVGDIYPFYLDLGMHQAIAAFGYATLGIKSEHDRDMPVVIKHNIQNIKCPTVTEILNGCLMPDLVQAASA